MNYNMKSTNPFLISAINSDRIRYNYGRMFEDLNKNQVNKLQNFSWKNLKKLSDKRGSWRIRMEDSGQVWSQFKHFCETSSLHGFNFFIRDEKTAWERLWWIVALCIVYGCCGILITNSVRDWWSSPAIMSIENTPIDVGFFPFPAVTICNTNQIKASAYNISARLQMKQKFTGPDGINASFVHEIDYVHLICKNKLDEELTTTFLDYGAFYNMLNNAHGTCEETYTIIKWMNESFGRPCEFMQPVLTDLGVCYSYNMLPYAILLNDFYLQSMRLYRLTSNWSWINHSDWTPERAYGEKPVNWKDIPRRTSGAGNVYSYTACLSEKFGNVDQKCNDAIEGFTVLLHSPADFPTSLNAVVAISKTSTQAIIVQPYSVRTSPQIKNWSPSERGCYYDRERSLHYFQLYTEANCKLECESNFSLAQCGCVAYYHPRSLFTPICGTKKIDCIEDSLVKFSELNINDKRKCSCLPSCTILKYKATVRTVGFITKPVVNTEQEDESDVRTKRKREVTEAHANDNISIFAVYYDSGNTLGYIRVPLISFSDFVGNLGGILGLFLGFSLICCLEIVYFFIIRPLENTRKRTFVTRTENQLSERNFEERLPKNVFLLPTSGTKG